MDGARNGVEAMEMISGCRYSLVILDLMMPRLSGYEVIEQLRRLSVKVAGTIHKPFDVELLLDIMSGFLASTGDLDQLDDCPPDSESADAGSSNWRSGRNAWPTSASGQACLFRLAELKEPGAMSCEPRVLIELSALDPLRPAHCPLRPAGAGIRLRA